MRVVHGRSAWVPRVPNFEANDRLKFTAEERQAIQAAERAFGYRPQSGNVVRPRPRRGLAFAIASALAYFLLSTFVAAFLHSFPSPKSPRESGAPMAETIQREAQSQAIPNDMVVRFADKDSKSDASPDIVPPETSPRSESFYEQEHPRQLPRTSTALSHFVDERGRVIFVNENTTDFIKKPVLSRHTDESTRDQGNIRRSPYDPASALGQITPVGPSSGLPRQVIGEEK